MHVEKFNDKNSNSKFAKKKSTLKKIMQNRNFFLLKKITLHKTYILKGL